MNPSVFEGVTSLLEKHLSPKVTTGDAAGVMSRAYDRLRDNWTSHWEPRPLEGIWRRRVAKEIDQERNTSPEVRLERALASLGDSRLFNQVPVASGLIKGRGKKAAVDLGYEVGPGHYELIELKIGANEKPYDAAQELVRYALAYVLCRAHIEDLKLHDRELLAASRIGFVVLADEPFYAGIETLSSYSAAIEWGLQQLVKDRLNDSLEVYFRFESLPADFKWPNQSGFDEASKEIAQKAFDGRRLVGGNRQKGGIQ